MMKKLLLCALLCSTMNYACTNRAIAISNCYRFFEDVEEVVAAFEKAAKKAKIPGFQLYQMHGDDNLLYYYYLNDEGCISLCINLHNDTCVVDFYCIDDSFNYKKFLGSFLKTCYSQEKPHMPTITIGKDKSSGPYNLVPTDLNDEDYFDRLIDGEYAVLELK